ncbi:MAG: hypothetical protein JRG95_16285 [Deltaproteobacteria bacterium]|nr:hypothetical protein [Deltaproteobacteria bacterium]
MRLCIVLVAILALGLASCARYPGGVAASNVPIGQNGYDVLGLVSAADCKVNLFGILPVSGGNQVSDAIKLALAHQPNADALIGVTVDRVVKYFILWSQVCTEVRATAVRRR